MIEVVDPDPTRGVERRERRGTAGVVGEPGPGRPHQSRPPELGAVELLGAKVHVRRSRLAVEQDRKAIRRIDLGEDHRRAQRRIRPDPPRVDAEAG